MIDIKLSRKQIVKSAYQYPEKAIFRADLDNLMNEDVRRLLEVPGRYMIHAHSLQTDLSNMEQAVKQPMKEGA